MKPVVEGYPYEVHREAIRRAAYQKLADFSDYFMREVGITTNNRWIIEELKTELELHMMTFLTAENQVPIGPARLIIEARIEQKSISDEILYITKGKRLAVPENQHYVMWHAPSVEYALPLTESEKSYTDGD
jgi:hypothetical protein